MPRARKLIAIPEDILDELIKLAQKNKMNIGEFIEVILTNAIKAIRNYGDLIKYFDEVSAYIDIKRLGGVIVPYRTLYKLLDNVSDDVFNDIVKESAKLMEWFFSVSRARGGSKSLKRFIDLLSLWLPDARIEVVEHNNGKRLIVSSPNQGMRATILTNNIVHTALKAYGMNVVKSEYSPGLIVIDIR